MNLFTCGIDLANACSSYQQKTRWTYAQYSSGIFASFKKIFVQHGFNTKITLTSLTVRAFTKKFFCYVICTQNYIAQRLDRNTD